MARFQLIDTTTGEIVREQRTLYGQPVYRSRKHGLLTPHEQNLVIFTLIGLVLGIALF